MNWKCGITCYFLAYCTFAAAFYSSINTKAGANVDSNESDNYRRSFKMSRKSDDTDLMTRMGNIENALNKIIKAQEDLNYHVRHLVARVDVLQAKTDKKSEVLEDKVGSLVESSSFIQHQLLSNHNVTGAIERNVRDVKRATFLLAITELKLADLPYMTHCERHDAGDEAGSHMYNCLETRVEELYNGFNNVLDFHIILMGGKRPHEGRVEIIYRGRHGTICDYNWSWNDMNVVCKMLGYPGGQYGLYNSVYFGNGTGEILLDDVDCTGDENSLFACKHRGIGGNEEVGDYCHHGRDTGVRCRT